MESIDQRSECRRSSLERNGGGQVLPSRPGRSITLLVPTLHNLCCGRVVDGSMRQRMAQVMPPTPRPACIGMPRNSPKDDGRSGGPSATIDRLRVELGHSGLKLPVAATPIPRDVVHFGSGCHGDERRQHPRCSPYCRP